MTVISDFNDLEKVGRKHYLTVHGAQTRKNWKAGRQGACTGADLRSAGNVTQSASCMTMVCSCNRSTTESSSRRTGLRKPASWNWRSGKGAEAANAHEWVQLPASRIKLERAMLRAGIPSCGEMQMLVADSRFPDEVDCALDFEHESLFELNRLCRACSNFKEQNFVKLGAVCQMAKPACAANIRQLAENSINLISHQMSTRRRSTDGT